jgi:hypothetical protein
MVLQANTRKRVLRTSPVSTFSEGCRCYGVRHRDTQSDEYLLGHEVRGGRRCCSRTGNDHPTQGRALGGALQRTHGGRTETASLSAARGDRLEALYVLAVHTGLRQGELLAGGRCGC